MKFSRRTGALCVAGALFSSTLLGISSAQISSAAAWCSGVNVSYFKGGTADGFSDILQKGAQQAGSDKDGPTVC